MNEIKGIIIKTLISIQPLLSNLYRSGQSESYKNDMCFEILGLFI